ncbi:MAG: hypothetical protein GF334_13345, partial [Candidatus Altiarchaeales archaeon]|nr:hypothetical protein [Candidatus Altiarchaeales archaeon]
MATAQEAMRGITKTVGADATHDPQHVLRVPGTVNHKEPEKPVPVKVIEERPALNYKAEDLLKLTNLSATTLTLMATGAWENRFPSRSERDWHVLRELLATGVSEEAIVASAQQRPWGERYREKPHTIETDLRKAESPFAGAETHYIEYQDCWFYATSKGKHQVSTFTFDPQRLLIDPGGIEEDAFLGTVHADGQTWEDVRLPRSAFSSQYQMHKNLPNMRWQWMGNDYETRQLLVYLLGKMAERGLGETQAVGAIGRHGEYFVTKTATLTADNILSQDESPYIFRGATDRGNSARDTTPAVILRRVGEQEYRHLVWNISHSLPELNLRRVAIPMIGWFMSCPMKPIFNDAGIRFPHLNVYGTQGSGKTTSLLQIYMPLLGIEEAHTWDVDTTQFVHKTLLSTSNALPVIFGEFRSSTAHGARTDFLGMLRRAYDTGMDARGRADQRTNIYPLEAPIILDGEDPVGGTGALRERCIIVQHNKSTVDPGTDARSAYEDLADLPLWHFAVRYL